MYVVSYIQYIGIYALVSLQEQTDIIENILGRKELQCAKEVTQITRQWKENSEMAAYLKNNTQKSYHHHIH